MRVKIGPYKNWFGPYQLASALCFWAKQDKDKWGIKSDPDWVHNFGEWLAHGSVEPDPTPENPHHLGMRERPTTWLYKFLNWVHLKQKRKIEVRIDPYDVWSMDHTLAHIIAPMLKELKNKHCGAPAVDDKDVPKHLQSSSAPPLTQEEKDHGATDELYFERWNWVLDEMIFAFESKLNENWQNQFYSGESDYVWVATEFEDGKPTMYRMEQGPNHTYKVDMKGMKAYQKRISNGFKLFGKYYENLWD